ncbi:hypothetical protein N7517_001912 [Penicillium concentricum]|uniref:Uncharacterized protein n=1 Tax=Penicillium concentricum TaxID=293559 RepID=A0A9W9SSQ0_9EURO|nr:uncharacterized protein N7517_001912 [Penicillium concentricum]KAJ5384001.1 hypothetical protein N7517_001912 [Penicillium concentricum]
MAPIPGFANDNTLSPRANSNHEVDMERELFLMKLLFGMIIAAIVVFLGYLSYLQLKPPYKELWKPKLKPKLEDCREKYEGWKKKMAWNGPKEPKAPEPAHVARHVSQAPEVKPIVRDLTPEYMRMSTAAMV